MAISRTPEPGATTIQEMKVLNMVSQYESCLLRFVQQLVHPDEASGRDIVQMTFIKFHKYLLDHGPESIENPKAWLFQVARNLGLDTLRKNKRKQKAENRMKEDPVICPDFDSRNDEIKKMEKRELYKLAMGELHTLPEEYKELLLMKHIQGLTLQEISDITGIKLGTVNYRIKQGLSMLAAQLRAKRIEVQL